MSGRNLFLFSDGTGNAGGKTRGTNVYRLYNAVDRNSTDPVQLAFYDDGVGTSDNALYRALGGAFGVGLSRNIRELYEWLVLNYREGDRIFLFGFSRGAFTVRCVAGLVRRCGILKRKNYLDLPVEARMRRLRQIVRSYRAVSEIGFEELRGNADEFQLVRIAFVGVWDTVDAVGMPVDELRPIIDMLSKLLVRRRAYGFDDRELCGVEHARQALAIDDERRTFHPNVWYRNPAKNDREAVADVPTAPTDASKIRQVWFAGAHSNVGGGYPKDHLAQVTLDWMMGEIEQIERDEAQSGSDPFRVKWKQGAREGFQSEADAYGRHYDPRTGLAVYYRYSPRRLAWFYTGEYDFWARRIGFWRKRADLPRRGIEIHTSVFRRILRGTQGYAPLLLLPDDARLKLNHSFGGNFTKVREGNAKVVETVQNAAVEARRRLSSMVITRQTSYAVMLGVTLVVVVRGFTVAAPEATGGGAEFLKGLVPEIAAKLVDAAFAYPQAALLYLLVLAVAGGISLHLKNRIARATRQIYEKALEPLRDVASRDGPGG